ncbi:hypothetical protein F5Y15DRAFT_231991 [Xylariaceae sp. FL0016]|nr:hypothetical protein F5Y15DRAFT_231991 [Xylariaceae sp. FL0016]
MDNRYDLAVAIMNRICVSLNFKEVWPSLVPRYYEEAQKIVFKALPSGPEESFKEKMIWKTFIMTPMFVNTSALAKIMHLSTWSDNLANVKRKWERRIARSTDFGFRVKSWFLTPRDLHLISRYMQTNSIGPDQKQNWWFFMKQAVTEDRRGLTIHYVASFQLEDPQKYVAELNNFFYGGLSMFKEAVRSLGLQLQCVIHVMQGLRIPSTARVELLFTIHAYLIELFGPWTTLNTHVPDWYASRPAQTPVPCYGPLGRARVYLHNCSEIDQIPRRKWSDFRDFLVYTYASTASGSEDTTVLSSKTMSARSSSTEAETEIEAVKGCQESKMS